jgi:4,5-DOPA dioxygenase extradiol
MTRLPVLFVGHGSPMNAIEDNPWSRAFAALGGRLPKPKGILSVSAHWFVPGTFVTANPVPPTIHDFGGFPDELHRLEYRAQGDAALAERVARLAGQDDTALRTDWGLDHGTWSVLHHLRPDADVPVVQLSVDRRLPPAAHLDLARRLAPLREEGVLVMGSGNVTHNLRHAFGAMHSGDTRTPEWASAFDAEVARAAEQHDAAHLVRAVETDAGRLSQPTLDHYLPLLYAVGAASDRDTVTFPITGWDLGSLSMRAVLLE